MKKQIAMLLSSAMAIGSLAVMPAQAEDSTLVYGGLVYTKLNDSCVVLSEVTDKSITKVTIPDKIDGRDVDIDEDAFSECYSLTEFDVDENNINVCDIDGVLFNKEKRVLLACPKGIKGAYNIPEGTEVIAANAFANAKALTYVNVPDSLKSIWNDAFRNCTSLTGFSKPVPADSTGCYIYGCTSLKEFELAETAEETRVVNFRFENCPNLKRVVIPESYILNGAFKVSNCPELVELVIPSYTDVLSVNITKCDKLEKFVIPEIYNFKDAYSGVTIDYATCPELKDVYYYGETGQPKDTELERVIENDVTVHCRKSESNAKYYEAHNINYVFLEDEADYGDVNKDGSVSLADAVLIMQSVSNPDKYRLSAEQKLNADVCGNDGITATDALTIQKYTLGLVENLPV